MKKRVICKFPVLSQSGYGEHARFVLRALRSRPDLFDIYAIPLNWGQSNWLHEDSEERRFIDECIIKHHQNATGPKTPYDISIQVTIPNEFELMAPVNIGVTAGIETTKVSPQWLEKCNMMDRIVVVSEHSKETFINTTYKAKDNHSGREFDYKLEKPIYVVGYPVKSLKPATLELQLEHDFNFLAVAQWGPRKNLDLTIKWFIEEFKNDAVGLIVKTSVKNNSKSDRLAVEEALRDMLEAYPDRKCSVHLLHGSMTDEEVHGLYLHPKVKALVNIGAGEGFGLPLFEAAYSGLPVATIDWSGQRDFLYAPRKKDGKVRPMFAVVEHSMGLVPQHAVWDGVIQADSMWAYPKEGSYKNRLREIYKDYGRFKAQAKELQKHVCETFTEEKQYAALVKSIVPEQIWLDELKSSITEY